MKKILLTLIVAVMGCMTAMAGSDLKVVEGDKKFLKTASGNAVLIFDWEGATYDNKEPLTNHYSNLEQLKPIAWNGFVEEFNKKSKNVKVVKDATDARYQFSMQVTNMDMYVKVMSFIPSPATKVWGVMTVTDLQTGEVIAIIQVKEVNGGGNPSPDGSFSDCFEELGKQMAKLK